MAKVICENNEKEILTDACWSLTHIVDGAPELIEDFMDERLLTRLSQLVTSEHLSIQIPLIRAFGNLTTGTNEQIARIV